MVEWVGRGVEVVWGGAGRKRGGVVVGWGRLEEKGVVWGGAGWKRGRGGSGAAGWKRGRGGRVGRRVGRRVGVVVGWGRLEEG